MTNNDFLKKLGMEIKVARIRSGLTTAQVCEATGLCKSTVLDIESGKTDTKILSYKRIADALQVEVKNFL